MIRKNHYLCCRKHVLLFKMPESLYKTYSPLISIVMPIYNASPYLIECINSIREQSYQNWELIAVDDFSTDNSPEILNDFTIDDARIKAYSNDHKGIIPALKKAESKACGELLSRMDADDVMPQDKLERLLNGFRSHKNAELVTGKVRYISCGKHLHDGYKKYAMWLNSIIDSGDFVTDRYKECVIASPNWLIKRDTLTSIGGICSNIYPEDYDFTMRVLLNEISIMGVDSITHIWRDHPDRTSRNSETYSDNSFTELKCLFFKQMDYNPDLPPVLWGAGKRAKQIAKEFNALGIRFHWICNNTKKAGHKVYGQFIYYYEEFSFTPNQQVIIATTLDRASILNYCHKRQLILLPFC